MRRALWVGFLVMALLGSVSGSVRTAMAQQDVGADPAFSNQLLAALGLPEISLVQPTEGPVEGVPAEVSAGRYLVSLEAAGDVAAYVNLVQIPAGISLDEATEQVLDTARNDMPHEGYVYGGGSYALPNETVWFAVDLEPGDWYVAASRQAGMGGEEIMELVPLTGGLTPAELTWVGYAAILSPGQTVWEEFTFEPGNYLAVSYVFDSETAQPAFALGMVEPFTVEGDGATPIPVEATPVR